PVAPHPDAAPTSYHGQDRYAPQPQQGMHGAPDEPTWASGSLGLGARPASASQWQESDEPTWAGNRQAPVSTEPAPEPPTDAWLRLEEEPEAESWRDRTAKATTPFRRRRGGSGRFGLPIILTAVVLVLLLVAGGVYVWFQGAPGISDETKYLDGVSVSSLMSKVEREGFECIPGRAIAQCEKQVTGADLSVTVHFASEGEVTKIEASGGTAAYSDDEVAPEELESFFSMAAALPLPSESGDADAVASWATENIGKAAQQTVGGVRYESSGDQPLLVMTPA
ncbi:MAG: hypothetical protein ACRDTM_04640, partial [Micromonosporaceae bacterium]